MDFKLSFKQESISLIDAANDVLNELREYWPLTLRGLYYQLVASMEIENSSKSYKRLGRLLGGARMAGLVPWRALHDQVRRHKEFPAHRNQEAFLQEETELFLVGYERDLTQDQPVAVEVWVEKDALYQYVVTVAEEYQVPVVVSRGFSSLSYVHNCAERIQDNFDAGFPKTHILYFGDLDPSGWEIPRAINRRLDEMIGGDQYGREGMEFEIERVALHPEHVQEFDLPNDPSACKRGDSRFRKFTARFGSMAVELDALRPPQLQQMVREAIEDTLDTDLFEGQKQIQRRERADIREVRKSVISTIKESLGR